MHFIYQRFAVLENEQVVLPKAFGDDFREEVEVAFPDDVLPLRQIDGLPQCAAHVDVAGVEILDHEEGLGKVLERLQELRDVGHFFEKCCREMLRCHKSISPFFGALTIAFDVALT